MGSRPARQQPLGSPNEMVLTVLKSGSQPADYPQAMRNPYIHGSLVAVALLWFWQTKVVPPSGPEAIGFDLGGLVLPGLLLWFSGSRFKEALAQRGVVAPYRWMIGGICAVWGTSGLLDRPNAAIDHGFGVFVTFGLFWLAALFLFVTAKLRQSQAKAVRAAP